VSLSFLARLDARKRASSYYESLGASFEAASGGSGYMNLGLYASGEESIAEAQERLVDLLAEPLPRSGHWLDVGCGVGGPALRWVEQNPALRVTGLNLSPEQLARCPRHPRLRFLGGDADCMPFLDESFQAVVSLEAAFHFRDRLQFLQQAWRALEPGGWLALTDIGLREGQMRLYDGLLARGARRLLGAERLMQSGDWRNLLTTVGFVGLQVQDLGPRVWPHMRRWSESIEDAPLGYRPLAQLGARYLAEGGKDTPLAYLMIRARKPETAPPLYAPLR
jgi:MPBQ/MSBQ methyltransferase